MNRWISIIAWTAGLTALAAGCQPSPDPSKEATMETSKMVSGTVTYRERMALPPGAIVVVRLEDVSRADAPAPVLAEETIQLAGKQVPVPFRLKLDPAAIDSRARYNVRAQILVDDRVWFASTTAHPVLNDFATTDVEVLVSRAEGSAGAPTNSPATAPSATLQNTYWKLVELGGHPLVVGEFSNREPHFVLETEEQRFHGSGGVNRILGGYKLEGEALAFMPGPSTLMAGPPELMKQEDRFVKALMSVSRFELRDQQLSLFAGDKLVMKLEATYLK